MNTLLHSSDLHLIGWLSRLFHNLIKLFEILDIHNGIKNLFEFGVGYN
ncbi:MAG: hypothetical protein AAF639_21105 [Chloroflexota bacterium]